MAVALLAFAVLGAYVLTRRVAKGPRLSYWTLGFGDDGYQTGGGVVVHGDTVTVSGAFTGSFTMGADSLRARQQDAFVISFDLSGKPQWTRTFSEPGEHGFAKLAVDDHGNVIVAGRAEVSKLGRDGTRLWNRATAGIRLYDVAVDARGRVVLAGSRREGRSGLADEDAVVVMLDGSGSDLWMKTVGGPRHQSAEAVAVDGTGAIVLAGNFAGDTDVAGIALHSEGTGLLDSDTFLARLDDSGAAEWAVTVPISIGSIACGGDGRIVAVGSKFPDRDKTYANPGRRAVVAQFDRRGEEVWQREFDAGVAFNAVAVARDGSVFAAGSLDRAVAIDSIALTPAGDQDILVVRLDERGGVRAAERFGGPLMDYAVGVATDAEANLVMTGASEGQVDFASGSVVGGGDRDVFVTTFALSGERSAVSAAPPSPAAGGAGEADAWASLTGPALGAVSALAVDSDLDVFASGVLSGTIVWGDVRHEGRGRADVHLAKLDAGGRVLWSRAFGDERVQDAPSLSVDAAGNVYCGFQDRPYEGGWHLAYRLNGQVLVKLSPSGEEVWRYRYDDYGLRPPAFAVTPEATVTFARNSASSSELVRLDRMGKEAGSRRLDPQRFRHVECLAGLPTGGLVMVGAAAGPENKTFVLATDQEGAPRWSREVGAHHWPTYPLIAPGRSGEVVIGGAAGELSLPGASLESDGSGTESFVAQFDSSGGLAWAQRLAGNNRLHALLVRADGSVVAAGEFDGVIRIGSSQLQSLGSMDAFVVVLDPTGVVRSSRRLGGSEPDTIYALADAGAGRVIVAGTTAGSIDFPGGARRGTFLVPLVP